MATEDEIIYMNEHPPRCIRGRHFPADRDAREVVRRAGGSETTSFGVRCDCGNTLLRVALAEAVAVSCAQCGTEFTVFDPAQHGYNGELGLHLPAASGPPADQVCGKCGGSRFQLTCGFQYCGETDVLQDGDINVKPEDLFGYFLLVGRCEGCGETRILHEWECA